VSFVLIWVPFLLNASSDFLDRTDTNCWALFWYTPHLRGYERPFSVCCYVKASLFCTITAGPTLSTGFMIDYVIVAAKLCSAVLISRPVIHTSSGRITSTLLASRLQQIPTWSNLSLAGCLCFTQISSTLQYKAFKGGRLNA